MDRMRQTMAGESAVEAPRGQRTSAWAVASLLFSLALFCGPVGILLGARALVEIKGNHNLRGRGLALAGICIGSLSSAAIVLVLILWHSYARVPMLNGPVQELRMGLAGDIAGFKAGFTSEGHSVPDEDATLFLHELKQRYGEFIDAQQNPATSMPAPQGDPVLRIPYAFRFSRATVDAEAGFRTFGTPRSGIPSLHFAWEWIRIVDPTQGDLVFPETAKTRALAKPQAANNP